MKMATDVLNKQAHLGLGSQPSRPAVHVVPCPYEG